MIARATFDSLQLGARAATWIAENTPRVMFLGN
jgi:hypothetical protein